MRTALVHVLDNTMPSLSVALRARFGGSREPELAVLPALVLRGDTVLDIGAYRGLYSWHLARLVGRGGAVHAFEPQPDLARYLMSAFRHQREVQVHCVALSDRAGTADLITPDWAGKPIMGHATLESELSDGAAQTVVTKRLDELELVPSFLKIDVEGHEAAVIAGAIATLERWRPTVLLEIMRWSADDLRIRRLRELLALMNDLGYHPAVVDSRGGQFDCFDVNRLWDFDDPIAEDRRAYNFLFISDQGRAAHYLRHGLA